jgi:HK97 family phage major capsid protein
MAKASMRELLERRSSLKDQLAAIHNGSDGALSEPAQTQWNKLEADLKGVESDILRQSVLDDTERRMSGQPVQGARQDSRWSEMLADYSLARALMHYDPQVDHGREREVSQEMEKRVGRKARGVLVPDEIFLRKVERRVDQNASSGPAGGFLVADNLLADQYIDRLRAHTFLDKLGVGYLTGLVGMTSVPRLETSGTIQWVAEDASPTPSALGFGQVSATPHTAAGQQAFSRRMLINATPSIEMLIRDDIAKQMAVATDDAAINGSAQAEPQGLIAKGLTVNSLGTNGAVFTYDNLVDLTATPDEVNALLASPAWLVNPKGLAAIRKLVDGYGRPYFPSPLRDGVLDYPVISSTTVPSNLVKGSSGAVCSAMFFGAWSQMLVCRWGGIDVLSNPYSAASSGQVLVHSFMDVDFIVRHLASFAAFLDVLA